MLFISYKHNLGKLKIKGKTIHAKLNQIIEKVCNSKSTIRQGRF